MATKQSNKQETHRKLIVGEDVICPRCDGFAEKFETILTKIDGLDTNIKAQFDYMDEKTSSAKGDMERRLEGMNEFRSQLARQAAEFITRQELSLMFEKQGLRIDQLADKLGVSRETMATSTGTREMSTKVMMSILAIGSSMFTGVILLIIHAIFKI